MHSAKPIRSLPDPVLISAYSTRTSSPNYMDSTSSSPPKKSGHASVLIEYFENSSSERSKDQKPDVRVHLRTKRKNKLRSRSHSHALEDPGDDTFYDAATSTPVLDSSSYQLPTHETAYDDSREPAAHIKSTDYIQPHRNDSVSLNPDMLDSVISNVIRRIVLPALDNMRTTNESASNSSIDSRSTSENHSSEIKTQDSISSPDMSERSTNHTGLDMSDLDNVPPLSRVVEEAESIKFDNLLHSQKIRPTLKSGERSSLSDQYSSSDYKCANRRSNTNSIQSKQNKPDNCSDVIARSSSREFSRNQRVPSIASIVDSPSTRANSAHSRVFDPFRMDPPRITSEQPDFPTTDLEFAELVSINSTGRAVLHETPGKSTPVSRRSSRHSSLGSRGNTLAESSDSVYIEENSYRPRSEELDDVADTASYYTAAGTTYDSVPCFHPLPAGMCFQYYESDSITNKCSTIKKQLWIT